MTREEAIKWLKNIKSDIGKMQFRALWGYEQAIDEIIKLLSAEPKWIPCSERLPEKDDLVLVTVWNDVTIAWRNIYGGWESAEDMYEKGDVIAWMPLPSPYREDGE